MNDYYETLAKDLLSVMADVSSLLEPVEVEEVQMYLDAGEFGLAFETLCAVLKRKQKPVSAATYVAISDLGERMDMEPSYWTVLDVS